MILRQALGEKKKVTFGRGKLGKVMEKVVEGHRILKA